MEPPTAAAEPITLSLIVSRDRNSPTDQEVEKSAALTGPVEQDKASQSNLEVQEDPATDYANIYPDSGLQAWLCVLGSFLFLYPSYGFMQSVGTVQTYLEAHQLSAFSSRDIGWITGVYTFLGLFFGIQVGPLFDRYGPNVLGWVGLAVYVPMFFLLAECQSYWQFMLCLGILGGIGSAICSTIAISIVSNWFMKRRGVATGIAMSGSSLGGVVTPIMLKSLYPKLGWTWSMRVLAFIVLAVLIMGNLLMRPNPRLKSVGTTIKKATIDFSAFGSAAFTALAVGTFALEFIIFGATGLLSTYAIDAHYPNAAAFNIIAIMNGASCFGRSLPGLAGDFFGPFNVLLVMIVFTLISMCVVWIPFGASSLVAFYVFGALWGFGTGGFLSIIPVCIGTTCDTKDFGRYYGTLYSVVSFSLLITVPLGGQMLQTVGLQALAGLYTAVLGFGLVSFLWARWEILERTWNIRAKV